MNKKELEQERKELEIIVKNARALIVRSEKKILTINKAIVKIDNGIFDEKSMDEKAVMIAEDVLLNLKTNIIGTAVGYGYCDIDGLDEGDNLKDYILEGNISNDNCTVCALGGMMISHVKIKNELTVSEANSYAQNDIHGLLTAYFGEEELTLIETAFEGAIMPVGYNEYDNIESYKQDYNIDNDGEADEDYCKSLVKAQKFNNNVSDSDKRLARIMKNIIKNKETLYRNN